MLSSTEILLVNDFFNHTQLIPPTLFGKPARKYDQIQVLLIYEVRCAFALLFKTLITHAQEATHSDVFF